MYHGNNAGNIDIRHFAEKLPTIMKAVINTVLASNIVNDHYWAQKIFPDNRYAFLELFVILCEYMTLIGGGTCRNSKIGFPGDA